MKAQNQFVKVNASFYKKMEQLEDIVEDAVKEELISIAQSAVSFSPVDTGAYVTSFSFTTGAGRPRGKSSDNKPKKQNPQQKMQEGFQNLLTDINKIDLKNTASVQLRNGSPHAYDVEEGTKWRRTPGYKVFAKIRNIYG
jgi:hypothetical protein